MAVIDVRFNLMGNIIPADHGYLLFSAISRIVPYLHSNEEVGFHNISGRLIGNRELAITDISYLTIRLDANRFRQVLPLAGKTIRLGKASLTIGTPQSQIIKPYPKLYSRIVTIKGFMEPEAFIEATNRQLESLSIKGQTSLIEQSSIAEVNINTKSGTHSKYLRRTIKIRDKEIVGFALRIEGLKDEESILLQEKGLGGRRRFGCGIFIHDRN